MVENSRNKQRETNMGINVKNSQSLEGKKKRGRIKTPEKYLLYENGVHYVNTWSS